MVTATYGLADPAIAAGMTGLEFLTAMKNGDFPKPPIGQRIPLEMHLHEHGRIVLRIIADDTYLNPGGIVHGGLALTGLDTAMGLAVLSTLGKGRNCASLDTSVGCVRALSAGSNHELEIIGTVVASGRTVATAEGAIRTMEGKLIATGTSACIIQPASP